MSGFLKKNAAGLKKFCLLGMLILPGGLFLAAQAGQTGLIWLFTALLAGVMALAMKIG